jgi:hypothetical protein
VQLNAKGMQGIECKRESCERISRAGHVREEAVEFVSDSFAHVNPCSLPLPLINAASLRFCRGELPQVFMLSFVPDFTTVFSPLQSFACHRPCTAFWQEKEKEKSALMERRSASSVPRFRGFGTCHAASCLSPLPSLSSCSRGCGLAGALFA